MVNKKYFVMGCNVGNGNELWFETVWKALIGYLNHLLTDITHLVRDFIFWSLEQNDSCYTKKCYFLKYLQSALNLMPRYKIPSSVSSIQKYHIGIISFGSLTESADAIGISYRLRY